MKQISPPGRRVRRALVAVRPSRLHQCEARALQKRVEAATAATRVAQEINAKWRNAVQAINKANS